MDRKPELLTIDASHQISNLFENVFCKMVAILSRECMQYLCAPPFMVCLQPSSELFVNTSYHMVKMDML